MKLNSMVLLGLMWSSVVHAEVELKAWPAAASEQNVVMLSIQDIQFSLPKSHLIEISTVGISAPNLHVRYGESEFSIFQNESVDIFGSIDKSKLKNNELYNVQVALEFVANGENRNKEFYNELNQVFMDGQKCCISKYVSGDVSAYLWRSNVGSDDYGYIFSTGDSRFFRFIGEIGVTDFETFIASVSKRQ